jgi:uncharacterized membrane protein
MSREDDENRQLQRSTTDDKVLGRLLALSDGIFAFAITLPVLNTVIPDSTTKKGLG